MRGLKLRPMALIMALAILAACLGGCADISRLLLAGDAEPLSFPVLAPEAEYRAASPEGPGQWIEVAQEGLTPISFQDPDLANLLLDAVEEAHVPPEMHIGCPMTNTVSVYSEDNSLLAQFLLAGDGDPTAALSEDGSRFALSAHVYGLLENQMWRQTRTLWSTPITWDPANGTAALELRMSHILNTLSVQAYGCMDGYFTTYRLYEPAVTEDKAQIYMLRSYACYAIEEDVFVRKVFVTVPARLTLERLDSRTWAVTGYTQCDTEALSARTAAAVQDIFPFAMVDQVVYDLKNADFSTELHQLAQDHLRRQGLGRMPIQE